MQAVSRLDAASAASSEVVAFSRLAPRLTSGTSLRYVLAGELKHVDETRATVLDNLDEMAVRLRDSEVLQDDARQVASCSCTSRTRAQKDLPPCRCCLSLQHVVEYEKCVFLDEFGDASRSTRRPIDDGPDGPEIELDDGISLAATAGAKSKKDCELLVVLRLLLAQLRRSARSSVRFADDDGGALDDDGAESAMLSATETRALLKRAQTHLKVLQLYQKEMHATRELWIAQKELLLMLGA